jgi:hypothetical protein
MSRNDRLTGAELYKQVDEQLGSLSREERTKFFLQLIFFWQDELLPLAGKFWGDDAAQTPIDVLRQQREARNRAPDRDTIEKYQEWQRKLAAGQSLRQIARHADVSPKAVREALKRLPDMLP